MCSPASVADDARLLHGCESLYEVIVDFGLFQPLAVIRLCYH
jgi:hypothetical protein